MVEKIFDIYHADYFQVMGYEIGIVDGDLAQALRELPMAQEEVPFVPQRNNAIKKLRLLMGEMHLNKVYAFLC